MKRRPKRVFALLSMLLAIVFVVASCGEDAPEQEDLVIRLASDPTTLQWAFTLQGFSMPGMFMATSLVTTDANGEPLPRLAESWEVNADRTRYEFKLSDDWVWSDGEEVTSADVKFSLEDALLNNHPFGGIFWSNVAGVETPEDDEVIINLTNPQELWGLLTPQYGPIVPKHIYEGTDMANHPTNNDPVVAGPYMLGEWSQGSSVILVRNPEWEGDKPYFNRIIYRIIPDADATVAALDRGEVHVSPAFPPLPPRDVARFRDDAKFQVIQLAPVSGDQDSFWLNNNIPPLDDKRVRQALVHAINRDAIVSTLYLNTVTVAGGHISHAGPNGVRFQGDFLGRYNYDPARANQLLDEAGYERGSDGTRFELKFIGYPTFPAPELADAVFGYWKEVGIEVSIDQGDEITPFAKIYEAPVDDPWSGYNVVLQLNMWTIPFIMNGYFNSSRIVPGTGTYWSNAFTINSPVFDENMAKVLSTAGDEQVGAMRQVQEVLADELPTIPITTVLSNMVADARVQNLPLGWGIFTEPPLEPFDISWDEE